MNHGTQGEVGSEAELSDQVYDQLTESSVGWEQT